MSVISLLTLGTLAAFPGPASAWQLQMSGVDCPTAAMLEGALPAPAEPGTRIVLTPMALAAGLPQPGRRLRLRLVDPRGVLQLDRVLAVDGARCEITTQAIALVIERHQREVAWSSQIPAPAPPPAAALSARPARTGIASPPPGAPRLLVLAGPALWSRAGLAPRAALEVRGRVNGGWWLGLGALVPGAVDQQALPGGGHAQLEAWPVGVRAGREARRGPFIGHAGLDLSLSFERGRSSAIASPDAGTRLLLAAGPALGLAWSPAPDLRLGLEATLARVLAGRDFEIAGLGEVLRAPPWQGLVALRVGWVVSP